MTVLKGETATRQSIALIRTFRAMKDYIIQNQPLIVQHRYLQMIAESQQQIREIRNDMQSYEALVMDHDEKLVQVIERLDDSVRKSELSPIMLDFSKEDVQREFLFLDGQPMKADAAYISINAQAKIKSCIVSPKAIIFSKLLIFILKKYHYYASIFENVITLLIYIQNISIL